MAPRFTVEDDLLYDQTPCTGPLFLNDPLIADDEVDHIEVDRLDEVIGDPRLVHRPGLMDGCADVS